MKAERFWPAVPEHIWDRIQEEFTLPAAADVQRRFEAQGAPEAMRQVLRVFVGDDTLCPGFQFENVFLRGPVLQLFGRAMELKVPHNVFAAWMITQVPVLGGRRPVDALDEPAVLEKELAAFADRYRPVTKNR